MLLFLQRFNVPHALEAYARGKWKATMAFERPIDMDTFMYNVY